MLVCRHCGWENPDEAAFCTNCGRGLARGRPGEAAPRFRALGAPPAPDVMASDNSSAPSVPRLRAPAEARSAPTLLDFRMPTEMLAELKRLREGDPPSPNEAKADEALAHAPTPAMTALSSAPPAAPAPVSDAPSPADALAAEDTLAHAPSAPPAARPAQHTKPVSTPPPAANSIPPRVVRPVTPPPEPVQPAPKASPASDALPPDLPLPPDMAPSPRATIVELPPVMLETVPPEPAPPPLPEAEPAPAEPPIVLLGEPVSEPTVPLESLDPNYSVVRPDERPLPGTDRIVPAAEIALSSRPPSAAPPEFDDDTAELITTMPAMSLGDIARALRKEVAADPVPESVAPEAEPPPAIEPLTLEEAESALEDGVDQSFDDVLEPSEPDGPPDEDDDADFDPDDDELVDDLAPDDALAGALEALSAQVAAQVEADEGDEPEATIIPTIEATPQPDVPQLLSTDEIEAIQAEKVAQPVAKPPPLPKVQPTFVLHLLNQGASDEAVVAIAAEGLEIGRAAQGVRVDDAWCSPHHARLTLGDGRLRLEDLDSLNGVWLRLRNPARLGVGDHFMVGQQIIEVARAEAASGPAQIDGVRRLGAVRPAGGFVLRVLGDDGEAVREIHLPQHGSRLGRHIAEIVFTDDTHMSTTHAVVRPDGDHLRLDDLQSRNGTWLKLREATAVLAGDAFMTGRTVWRVGQQVHPA